MSCMLNLTSLVGLVRTRTSALRRMRQVKTKGIRIPTECGTLASWPLSTLSPWPHPHPSTSWDIFWPLWVMSTHPKCDSAGFWKCASVRPSHHLSNLPPAAWGWAQISLPSDAGRERRATPPQSPWATQQWAFWVRGTGWGPWKLLEQIHKHYKSYRFLRIAANQALCQTCRGSSLKPHNILLQCGYPFHRWGR